MPIHYLNGYLVIDVPGNDPVPPAISFQPIGTFERRELAPGDRTYRAVRRAFPAMARDAILYQLTLQQPFGEVGYTVEVLGTHPVPTDPPGVRQWHDLLYRGTPFHITVWRRRVFYQRYGWLEVHWDPHHGETLSVHHMASTLPWAQARQAEERLRRGQGFLRQIERGRFEGSGAYPDRDDFRPDLIIAIRRASRLHDHPTQSQVGQWLPKGKFSGRQVQRWFREHIRLPEGIGWKTFVQRAQAP